MNDKVREIKLRTIRRVNESESATNHSVAERAVHHFEHVYEEKQKEANELIENAKQEIYEWKQQLLEQEEKLKQEAELKFQQAVAEGEKKGYEAGYEAGFQAYASEIKKAQQIIERAKEDYRQKLEESEPVMLQLAMEVAKKIIGDTLEKNEDAWIHLVKEAVKEVQGQEEIKIFVHPDWYEKTLNHQDEIKEIALHTRDVYIFPSHDVEENSCFIETPFGRLDASVDSQLKELKRALLEKLKEGERNEA